MSTRNRIRVDVDIVGGSVAGLWLLNLLRARGYSALLIERSAFGDGQTICSQGMIHGGLKYALSGLLGPASQTIAAMPTRWRNCLTGHGEFDLRGVGMLSDRCYLWSTNNSTLGHLAGFFASSLLRGRPRRLQRFEFPAAFDVPRFSGFVYELDELVIDTPSLLACLADQAHAGARSRRQGARCADYSTDIRCSGRATLRHTPSPHCRCAVEPQTCGIVVQGRRRPEDLHRA